MVVEDDIDAESLQAQVDTTMSFAHNLVTSWIKPSHLTRLRSSGVDATSILEEELRRPPRLGVGASVPSMSPLAHEASRLQRRLGKKGSNNQDVAVSQPHDPPRSDDEEHKGRPAKRKTKADPFGHRGNKKKKKTISEATFKHLLNDPYSTKEPQTGPRDQRAIVPLQSELSREASEIPVPGITSAKLIGLHTNSVPIPDKASTPLLNLDGSPGFIDKPGNGSEINNSIKRKRKKRKKKKTRMMAGTGDNLR